MTVLQRLGLLVQALGYLIVQGRRAPEQGAKICLSAVPVRTATGN